MILWWLKAWQWHSESCKSLQALTRESQRRTAGCSTATALCICASTETRRKREHRWNSLAEHRTKLGSGGKIIEKLQDSMQEHRNDRKIVSKILGGHNSSQEIRKTQIRFKDETFHPHSLDLKAENWQNHPKSQSLAWYIRRAFSASCESTCDVFDVRHCGRATSDFWIKIFYRQSWPK